MALLRAASLMVTAVAEALSLVWMELAMFVVAGLLYALFFRLGSQISFRTALFKKKRQD